MITRERLDLIMDDSFIVALTTCADDKDAAVRRTLAQVAGKHWIWLADPQKPEAIKLLTRLAQDADIKIRRDAVHFGLSTVRDKSEEVVRTLIECALTDRLCADRVAWGLNDHPTAVKLLNEALRGDDPVRAEAAREVYRSIAHYLSESQPAEGADLAGTYAPALRALHEHLGSVYPGFRTKGIDWAKVGQELEPRAAEAKTERDFGLLVEELVARLEDSHAVVIAGTANPPQPNLPRWGPGLFCLIDDRGLPVVFAVEPGSPADKAGITPGRVIISVNGIAADAAIKQWMEQTRKFYGYSSERTLKFDAVRAFLAQPKRGGKVTLKTRSLDGREAVAELPADRLLRGGPKLPVTRPGISENANVSWTTLDGPIGYICIRRIQAGLEGSIDQALTDLGDMKGLIIDMRGNTGGGFDTNTAFVNFDLKETKAAGPERPKYKGQIALLIDERLHQRGRRMDVVVRGEQASQALRLDDGRSIVPQRNLHTHQRPVPRRRAGEGLHRIPRPPDRAPRH